MNQGTNLSVKQLALFEVAKIEFSRSSLHCLKFERRGFQIRRSFGHVPGRKDAILASEVSAKANSNWPTR
jgi:hypothetical protein